MAEGGHPGVESESVYEDIFNVIRLDWLQVPIKSTLGNNNDRLSLSNCSVLSLVQIFYVRYKGDSQTLGGYTFPTPNRPKRVGFRG